MSEETYSIKPLGHTVSFSDMLKAARDLEWLEYEVDPLWARFCSFGPDDIGSVWEKIGAIKKRPRYDTVMIGDEMLSAMKQYGVLDGSMAPCFGSCVAEVDARLFGLRIVGSPLLSNRAVLLNSRDV